MSDERVAECFDPACLQLDSGGGAMTAVAVQMGGAGVECREQVEALDAASPPLAPPARFAREDDRGLAVPMDEPRGDDPDAPRMPALAGDDDRRSITELLGEFAKRRLGSGRDLARGLSALV